jgi:hypothetical protein
VTRLKQIHLAAHFPGVNNTTVWSDPTSGSQIDFASFEHLARTAERGKFDFFFLAEGLRLREHRGRIFDLDVVGRPDSLTVLSALAAVTDHLGLAATLNTTFNEPYELARQFASLDHLSNGRAAECRHLARRLHRRELPAGRLPRARQALRSLRSSSAPRPSCGELDRTTPSSPMPTPVCSCATVASARSSTTVTSSSFGERSTFRAATGSASCASKRAT